MSQSPLADAREATRAYHESYYRQHKLFEPGSWLEKPDADLQRIIELPGDHTTKTCLDLGCGVGRNAIPLARAGYSVTCVDNLQCALDLLALNARAEGVSHRLQIECCEIDDFRANPHTFDVVLAISCLEHSSSVSQLKDVLQSLRECICNGGMILITMSTNRKVVHAESKRPVETLVETTLSPEEATALLVDCFGGAYLIESATSDYRERLIYRNELVDWSSTEIRFLATKRS